jgi:hypothetical protein
MRRALTLVLILLVCIPAFAHPRAGAAVKQAHVGSFGEVCSKGVQLRNSLRSFEQERVL